MTETRIEVRVGIILFFSKHPKPCLARSRALPFLALLRVYCMVPEISPASPQTCHP